MIKRPQPIKELIISPVFDGLIAIEIASKRAFDWMDKEANNFGDYTVLSESNASYATAALVISACFDVHEVIEYLLNPQYGKTKVLKIAGEGNGEGA